MHKAYVLSCRNLVSCARVVCSLELHTAHIFGSLQLEQMAVSLDYTLRVWLCETTCKMYSYDYTRLAIIIITIRKLINCLVRKTSVYREKSIPMIALWCPAFSNHG